MQEKVGNMASKHQNSWHWKYILLNQIVAQRDDVVMDEEYGEHEIVLRTGDGNSISYPVLTWDQS